MSPSAPPVDAPAPRPIDDDRTGSSRPDAVDPSTDAGPSAGGFTALGVPRRVADALVRRGITTPSPIQTATLPDALAGRDVCGHAPTGSGKTIAFGIPLVVGVGRARPRAPRGLVLVPTRELAAQVCGELEQLADAHTPRQPGGRSAGQPVRVAAFYGGVGFGRQITDLRRGIEIVVACPGRLADLVQQGELTLADVDFVVLDEADRMADMGFLPETRRLLDQCAPDRQTLLFSATLDAISSPPGAAGKKARSRAGEVQILIDNYQRNPVRHEHTPPPEDAADADHHFWLVERTDRLTITAAVINQVGPTVVFCRTKRGADRVARQLGQRGLAAAAIHGDRSQGQRERALEAFHDGEVQALVATDVAARGIHVDDVACVLHYDPPAEPTDYVHRSGRTARAGASGVVVTLVPADQRAEVRRMLKTLGHPPEITAPAVGQLPAATPRTRPAPERRRPTGSAEKHRGTNGPAGGANARHGARRHARPAGRGRAQRGRDDDRRPAGDARPSGGPRPSGKGGKASSRSTKPGRPAGRPGGSGGNRRGGPGGAPARAGRPNTKGAGRGR